MKLKFRHKVFLTFLLNSLVFGICTLLIARYFAIRNFEEYVNKAKMERLGELADVLGQEYQKSGSWTPVVNNPGHWLQRFAIGPGPPPWSNAARKTFLAPPPPPMEPPQGGPPPFDQPPGPPPEHHRLRVSLFDVDKRPLIRTEGSSAEEYQLKPIKVNDQLVGWLGVQRHERLNRTLDVEFQKAHSQTIYAIGGVALLLAFMVTFILSRHLLSPVKELAAGTRALTSGRFETRIEVRTRDEFGQLAEDFNSMVQALERDEQMKRQWIADISHELRTPLAILRGEIEAMQDGVREVTPEALESLHAEVLHVGRIVHDLHELSLIESGRPGEEQTAVNPLEILKEALKSFHTRFEQRAMAVEMDNADQVTVMADADRLRQLFSNLFENTLRYADAPGVLKISHESAPGSLIVHFEDSGPGVPEESLGLLFDRLYRIDKARSRAHGGSGLGLAICKSIVERFGGQIEASNASSGGLRITIVFPVISPETPVRN